MLLHSIISALPIKIVLDMRHATDPPRANPPLSGILYRIWLVCNTFVTIWRNRSGLDTTQRDRGTVPVSFGGGGFTPLAVPLSSSTRQRDCPSVWWRQDTARPAVSSHRETGHLLLRPPSSPHPPRPTVSPPSQNRISATFFSPGPSSARRQFSSSPFSLPHASLPASSKYPPA